ncbi:hypothetical protein F2P81_018400 [Scophthalmus maximus]|uniref:Uncharacterized protein n=1 Tax=Scophthalmus maximus TaxID=52904 RepID=A0A6A4SA99_SCOMX|nr:hypothetical protein F2P81_018400 [Scophthalmus maximus]
MSTAEITAATVEEAGQLMQPFHIYQCSRRRGRAINSFGKQKWTASGCRLTSLCRRRSSIVISRPRAGMKSTDGTPLSAEDTREEGGELSCGGGEAQNGTRYGYNQTTTGHESILHRLAVQLQRVSPRKRRQKETEPCMPLQHHLRLHYVEFDLRCKFADFKTSARYSFRLTDKTPIWSYRTTMTRGEQDKERELGRRIRIVLFHLIKLVHLLDFDHKSVVASALWAAVRTRVEGAELATKQIDRGSRRAESFRRQPDRERAEAAITHVCPDQDARRQRGKRRRHLTCKHAQEEKSLLFAKSLIRHFVGPNAATARPHTQDRKCRKAARRFQVDSRYNGDCISPMLLKLGIIGGT